MGCQYLAVFFVFGVKIITNLAVMKYESGEKIVVRDRDDQEWRQQWFVSMHPFRDKVVTVDLSGNLNEWFKSNSINYGSKEDSLRGDWKREIKKRDPEDEGCRWVYNGTDGTNGSYRVGASCWRDNNNQGWCDRCKEHQPI